MNAYLKSNEPEHNYNNDTPIFEIDRPEISDIIRYDNLYYYIIIFVHDAYVIVEKLRIFVLEGLSGLCNDQPEITCPYCLNEHTGTYNNVNGMIIKDFKCKRCGSVFNFEKNVKVTYTSCPVKSGKVRNI